MIYMCIITIFAFFYLLYLLLKIFDDRFVDKIVFWMCKDMIERDKKIIEENIKNRGVKWII